MSDFRTRAEKPIKSSADPAGITPQNILILNFNKLGDTLVQTQLYRGLKLAHQNCRLIVLSSHEGQGILKDNPRLDYIEWTQIIPDQSPASFLRYFIICQKLIRRFQIETIICDVVNATPITALLMNLLAVENRIYAHPRLKAPYTFLARRLHWINRDLSIDDPVNKHNSQLLTYLRAGDQANAEVFPSAADESRAAQKLRTLRKKSTFPLIAFVPFSRQPATSWPEANIVEFLNLASSLNIVIIGLKKDYQKIKPHIHSSPHVSFARTQTLLEAFCLINGSDLFVTLDTGPSHFFQALDVPMLKINSDRIPPQAWGYIGHKRFYYLQKSVPCGPCRSSLCQVATHLCLRDMTPLEVLRKIHKILAHTAENSRVQASGR